MKHHYNIKLLQLCVSVVFIFFITGCGSAKIKPQTINEKIIELADTNNKLIILDYQETNKDEYILVGHQYVLLFLPLGNVFLERPDDILFNKTFQELTLKGYHPLSNNDITGKNIPTLQVKILDSSVSAFDFLFLRKISSKITLEFNLLDKDQNKLYSWKIEENDSEWKEFAFELQLNYVFNKVLTKAIKNGVSQINYHLKKHYAFNMH